MSQFLLRIKAMSAANSHPVANIGDYAAIEAAVMETARGRWFLDEFSRRNRNANTDVLVATLARIEKTFAENRHSLSFDRFRTDLVDMARSIERLRNEIAAQHGGGKASPDSASSELDAIVRATEGATTEILNAAETVQEIAWTLREHGQNQTYCDALDAQATAIYTACSFQDLTAQRISKVVALLRYLESRLSAVIGIWGLDACGDTNAPKLEEPEQSGRRSPLQERGLLSQTDIDFELIRLKQPAIQPVEQAQPALPATTAIAKLEAMPAQKKAGVFF